MDSMTKQRRESEANGPQGQRPARVSRGGPSWTEFVRPAHQAVVAIAGADMINRAEPRACGHSREPRLLDTEPGMERNAGSASNAAGNGCGRAPSDEAGFQPYWGKPAVPSKTRPPTARRRGAPRGGPEQPAFERPPCAGRPPYGKTHSGSSNHRKSYEILFAICPERLKVVCKIQDITIAILPAPRSVKSNVLPFCTKSKFL